MYMETGVTPAPWSNKGVYDILLQAIFLVVFFTHRIVIDISDWVDMHRKKIIFLNVPVL
jgi:hypothetical protein